jgi:FtsZ-binding cell division protein ZapB
MRLIIEAIEEKLRKQESEIFLREMEIEDLKKKISELEKVIKRERGVNL